MKRNAVLAIALVFCGLTSCFDHDAESTLKREKLVAEGVQIRIDEFKKSEWDKCLEQARTLAVAEVDSIMRAVAKQEAVEPVMKPPKPERPEKPEIRMLPDSLMKKTKGEEND